MKKQFETFIEWCKEKGYKPNRAEVLLEYVASQIKEA